jgi:hypothetical protein
MSNNMAFLATQNTSNPNNNDSNDKLKPKAFKFGQVDSKQLLSRLYSTPFQKPMATGEQEYVLDMSSSKINKPRIRKLEAPPRAAEPVVRYIISSI